MGQLLRGSAATTHAVQAAIRRSKASISVLSARHGVNPKTVATWTKRDFVSDAPMGPKAIRSSVLSREEEAMVVAFRKHTLLPLDACLYALRASIPHPARSSLQRCFQRHGGSRLPEVEGAKPRKAFKAYPIGFFHIGIAEVRTEEGKPCLFVAIDRTGKFAVTELHELRHPPKHAAGRQGVASRDPGTGAEPRTAGAGSEAGRHRRHQGGGRERHGGQHRKRHLRHEDDQQGENADAHRARHGSCRMRCPAILGRHPGMSRRPPRGGPLVGSEHHHR
jgi:hypothetical protein